MRHLVRSGAVAALLVATVARGEDAADLRRLFPTEADVLMAPGGGLARLVLPPEVVAACRPDLSDLRIVDAGGKEVAYLIDSGVPEGAKVEVGRSVEATVMEVHREEIRREEAPPLQREVYDLAPPAAGPEGSGWELAVETRHGHFVRRLDIAGLRAGGATVALVENGSLFRLPSGPRERTRVGLPALDAERLRVTLEGEDGFFLEPVFRFTSTRAFEPTERATVPLEEVALERGEGRTTLELARPRGLVPDVLRLETTTGSFDRTVEVWDEGPGTGDVLLGRATLFRVQAVAPVEDREIALRPARGERLRVVVADGDSPVLEALAFAAVVRRPALIFALPAASTAAPAGTLYFGGGRAYGPRYDLAGLLPAAGGTVGGERATAAARLYDPAQVGQARLGSVRPNPAFDGAPALAFAMRPGTAIDTRVYSHRRRLTVAPSPEGLSRLRLAPEDLARARPDLADVRVVDGQSRQWPFLLESDAAKEWRLLDPVAATRRDSTSRYRLRLPASPLRVDQVVLESDAAFFDRAFRLVATLEDGSERIVAAGRLVQGVGRPRPLSVALAPVRARALELAVDDGSDAPLVFRAARARVLLPELFLAAPAGEYFLLVGNPEARAPSYELARVRDVVLAVSAASAGAAESQPNPDYSLRARLTAGEGRGRVLPQVALWVVLLGAVVILAVLTLRVARREKTGEPPVG